MTQMKEGFTESWKPDWKNMKSGDFKSPLKEFAGILKEWKVAPDNWNNSQVKFSFDKIQVYSTDQPYTLPTVDIDIRYSDRANSGWGRFGESMAAAMNVQIMELDLDKCIGSVIHVTRIDNVLFFTGKDGIPNIGSIWTVQNILATGEDPKLLYDQKTGQFSRMLGLPGVEIASPEQQAKAEEGRKARNATVSIEGAKTGPSFADPSEAQATPNGVDETQASFLTPGDDPSSAPGPIKNADETALSLLHGHGLAEFFQTAIENPIIQVDPTVSGGILSGTWLEAKKLSGEIVLNPENNTFSVVALEG